MKYKLQSKLTLADGSIIYVVPEGPCQFFDCPHSKRCKVDNLACESFARFVSSGGAVWKTKPRIPNLAYYKEVFPN